MSVQDVVEQLVEERSLDALERLTGSKSEEVLEALVDAAGRIIDSPRYDDDEDRIVETIRQHLVEVKAVGILVDALQIPGDTSREFALACLSEIGDTQAVPHMIRLLEESKTSASLKAAAAEHLALLTHYDFGDDPVKWRDWYAKLVKGRHEQKEEDREDKERMLKLQFRKSKEEEEPEPEPEGYDAGGYGGFGGYGFR